jgi:hypothetical protein
MTVAARWLSSFFFLTGACLLGLSAYFYFAPPTGSALEAQTDIEIADAAPGETRDVTLRLYNTSGGPVRVVGLAPC